MVCQFTVSPLVLPSPLIDGSTFTLVVFVLPLRLFCSLVYFWLSLTVFNAHCYWALISWQDACIHLLLIVPHLQNFLLHSTVVQWVRIIPLVSKSICFCWHSVSCFWHLSSMEKVLSQLTSICHVYNFCDWLRIQLCRCKQTCHYQTQSRTAQLLKLSI
jgi:hypothetical protein